MYVSTQAHVVSDSMVVCNSSRLCSLPSHLDWPTSASTSSSSSSSSSSFPSSFSSNSVGGWTGGEGAGPSVDGAGDYDGGQCDNTDFTAADAQVLCCGVLRCVGGCCSV